MVEAETEIVNRLGLHARAAAKLVHLASSYESEVLLQTDGQEVDAKSILGVLLLAAAQGMSLRVRCSGPDEVEALQGVLDLITDRFGEGE